MPDFTKIYRVEQQFKETVAITGADRLVVRQLSETAFILCIRETSTKTEYILSKGRIHGTLRTFTNLGRCVQFGVRMFGLRDIRFELLDEPIVEVNGD